jgi:hypothetical protein
LEHSRIFGQQPTIPQSYRPLIACILGAGILMTSTPGPREEAFRQGGPCSEKHPEFFVWHRYQYADWAIDGGRNANHVGKAEQFNPARAAVRRRMADPKTTACAPFRSAARCSSFSAAWRAARLQETVQVELVAASSTVSAAGGGRRAQFPNVECLSPRAASPTDAVAVCAIFRCGCSVRANIILHRGTIAQCPIRFLYIAG